MNIASLKNLLWACHLAWTNAGEDEEVLKRLKGVGFDAKRMQELYNLYKMVEELELDKNISYQESKRMSQQIEQQAEALQPLFRDHVSSARYAFRNDQALLKTCLPKPLRSYTWGWVEQASYFYKLLLPHAAFLSPLGVGEDELLQAQASVEALKSMRVARLQKKAKAEDCTDHRNRMITQLKDIYREFRTSAQLALKDQPQKLEAFGIRVRSLQ